MRKSQKILFFGFLLALAALVYLEATKPQPINWFPSYSSSDKIPLGTYVLYNLLEEDFGENFKSVEKTPFIALRDSTMAGNYLFINNNLEIDEAELNKLFAWAEKGNNIFLSANNFGNKLLDTLNLEMNTAVLIKKMGTEPMFQLTNENLDGEMPYHLKRDIPLRYFSEIDTLKQTVLGSSQAYNDTLKITQPLVNFIKAPIGKGNIFIHTQPEIFSNFFMLSEENAQHTLNVLSYINNGNDILWDKNYKSGKAISVSPLNVLLNNRYLKWAYYVVLIGTLLFVLFEGKRKQRSIPILKPLTNKTFEYTRTIAGMYLDEKQFHEIAKKQIALFLEYIRTQLRIPTEKWNTRFFEAVASRTGNTNEETKTLFTFIEKVENQNDTSQLELQKLYKKINAFKNKTDGKS